MKAKSTVPEKGKWLESAVEPSKQPTPQANEEELEVDLTDFPALSEVNNILEKLCRTPKPSVMDCEDASCWAHKKASALLIYAGYAEIGLHAEGSELVEPVAQRIMDTIQLELDIIRLAGQRLFSLCQAKDREEVQPAKTA